jgi:hypothetical protein
VETVHAVRRLRSVAVEPNRKERATAECTPYQEREEVIKKWQRTPARATGRGAISDRSQVETPVGWVKRDSETGRFLDVKSDGEPFKGVRKEHPANK